jgi:uncharacterized protein (TIGR02588 family)
LIRSIAIAEHKKQAEQEVVKARQFAEEDEHDPQSGNGRETEQQNESEIPPLEWAIACVGLALVVGALGLLLHKAIWGEASPPEVTVRVVSVVPVQNGYLVRFHAVNQGGSTAEGVTIEGELRRGLERVETSQTTLDYLPARSERRGGLFFSHDPRQFDFQLRAFGYEEP